MAVAVAAELVVAGRLDFVALAAAEQALAFELGAGLDVGPLWLVDPDRVVLDFEPLIVIVELAGPESSRLDWLLPASQVAAE